MMGQGLGPLFPLKMESDKDKSQSEQPDNSQFDQFDDDLTRFGLNVTPRSKAAEPEELEDFGMTPRLETRVTEAADKMVQPPLQSGIGKMRATWNGMLTHRQNQVMKKQAQELMDRHNSMALELSDALLEQMLRFKEEELRNLEQQKLSLSSRQVVREASLRLDRDHRLTKFIAMLNKNTVLQFFQLWRHNLTKSREDRRKMERAFGLGSKRLMQVAFRGLLEHWEEAMALRRMGPLEKKWHRQQLLASDELMRVQGILAQLEAHAHNFGQEVRDKTAETLHLRAIQSQLEELIARGQRCTACSASLHSLKQQQIALLPLSLKRHDRMLELLAMEDGMVEEWDQIVETVAQGHMEQTPTIKHTIVAEQMTASILRQHTLTVQAIHTLLDDEAQAQRLHLDVLVKLVKSERDEARAANREATQLERGVEDLTVEKEIEREELLLLQQEDQLTQKLIQLIQKGETGSPAVELVVRKQRLLEQQTSLHEKKRRFYATTAIQTLQESTKQLRKMHRILDDRNKVVPQRGAEMEKVQQSMRQQLQIAEKEQLFLTKIVATEKLRYESSLMITKEKAAELKACEKQLPLIRRKIQQVAERQEEFQDDISAAKAWDRQLDKEEELQIGMLKALQGISTRSTSVSASDDRRATLDALAQRQVSQQ